MLCYIKLRVGMIPLTWRQNRQWAYHGTNTYYPVNGERQRLNNERYRGPSLCAIVMQIIRGETLLCVPWSEGTPTRSDWLCFPVTWHENSSSGHNWNETSKTSEAEYKRSYHATTLELVTVSYRRRSGIVPRPSYVYSNSIVTECLCFN